MNEMSVYCHLLCGGCNSSIGTQPQIIMEHWTGSSSTLTWFRWILHCIPSIEPKKKKRWETREVSCGDSFHRLWLECQSKEFLINTSCQTLTEVLWDARFILNVTQSSEGGFLQGLHSLLPRYAT